MVKTSPKPNAIFPFVPETVAPAGSAASAKSATARSATRRTRPLRRDLTSCLPLPRDCSQEKGPAAAVLGPVTHKLLQPQRDVNFGEVRARGRRGRGSHIKPLVQEGSLL